MMSTTFRTTIARFALVPLMTATVVAAGWKLPWTSGGKKETPAENRNEEQPSAEQNAPDAGASPISAARARTEPSATASQKTGDYPMELWDDPQFRRQFMGTYGVKADVEPKVGQEQTELLKTVMDLMANENLDGARAAIEKALTPAHSAVFHFILGNIHFQQDALDQAAQAYRKAISRFPTYLRAQKNLGMVYVRQADFRSAIKPLTRALELGAGSGLIYGLLGYSHGSEGNHIAAESAYRTAMLLQPDSGDWQMGLAQTLFKQDKYAEAAALCDVLLAEDPGKTQLWLLQANAYLGLEKPLKAAQNYEYLRTTGDVDAGPLNTLGDIYVNRKKHDLAAQAYLDALDADPGQSVEQPLRNARVLAQRGALDETRRLVTKIRETYADQMTDERQTELLSLQARIALQEGNDARQARILKEIIEVDPLDGQALILLGRYHARQGEPEKAVMYYERAARIEGFEAKAKIRHAQVLVQQSRFQKAIPLLKSALRIKHRDDVADYLTQVEAVAKARQ